MKPLEPPDLHHLQAAQGWLELGNLLEANEELAKITPQLRGHPTVLALQWSLYAEAKKWEACVDLAKALTNVAPDQAGGWVNLGNSLYYSGHTQEAYDCVKPLLDRFPKNSILRYNLACYACQLGDLQEAKSWLEMAFELNNSKKLKLAALNDPDLEPLWKNIAEI